MQKTDHPNSKTLMAYMDEQLDDTIRHQVAMHLIGCETCSARIESLQKTSWAVREMQPSEGAFSSDGAFWASLASQLAPQQHTGASLVELVPTIVLGVLTAALHGLASLVFLAHSTLSLGLVPAASEQLQSWTNWSWVRWLGRGFLAATASSPLAGGFDRAFRAIAQVDGDVQQALMVSVTLGLLGVLSTVLLGMWFSWIVISQQGRASLQYRRQKNGLR